VPSEVGYPADEEYPSTGLPVRTAISGERPVSPSWRTPRLRRLHPDRGWPTAANRWTPSMTTES